MDRPRPRWTFHFTPTSASSLNAVEGFSAILAKRRLKRGVWRSVANLQATINRFLEDHNTHSNPFECVADPDKNHRRRQTGASSVRFDPLATGRKLIIRPLSESRPTVRMSGSAGARDGDRRPAAR